MKTQYIFSGVLNWPQVMQICDQPAPMFKRVFSPHHNSFLQPKYIVLHFTVGGAMQGTVDWFCNPESKVSSHFIIDRNGDICQCVSLDSVAWHCGKSEWKGNKNLNPVSVGIELCNWGPLRKDMKDGKYYPWHCDGNTVTIPIERVENAPLTRGDSVYHYWEKFPAKQLISLALLIHAISTSFPIEDVLAHSEIAPGRKIDPGHAFPLQLIKDYSRIASRLVI